jgi:hypothetical protein
MDFRYYRSFYSIAGWVLQGVHQTVIHHQLLDEWVLRTFVIRSGGSGAGYPLRNVMTASGYQKFAKPSRCVSSLEHTTASRRKIVPQKSTPKSLSARMITRVRRPLP